MGRRGRSGGMPHKVASEVGAYGERLAARYLAEAGLEVLDRNWRCAQGEVDIVALDGDCLVVCEVKTRRGQGFGDPVEAVTWRKAARLRRLAACWLAEHPGRWARGRRAGRRGRRPAARSRPGAGGAPRGGGDVKLGRTRSVALVGLDGAAGRRRGAPRAGAAALHDQRAAGRGAASSRPTGSRRPRPTPACRSPNRRLTVNLSPASMPKAGSGFDLPIAIAVLAAAGLVPAEVVAPMVHIGELGLDGSVRPVRGVLPAVLAAARARRRGSRGAGRQRRRGRAGARGDGAARAARWPRWSAATGCCRRAAECPEDDAGAWPPCRDVRARRPVPDLRDVVGQDEARLRARDRRGGWAPPAHGRAAGRRQDDAGRAAARSAARPRARARPGGHGDPLAAGRPAAVGGPGRPARRSSPRTTARRWRPSSAAAAASSGPARSPGPTAACSSSTRRRSSGSRCCRPCASRSSPVRSPSPGPRDVVRYPARFQLVLAANPCPCGRGFGKGADCSCTPRARRDYLGKLVGPLLDRVDLQVAGARRQPGRVGPAVRRGHRRGGRARAAGPRDPGRPAGRRTVAGQRRGARPGDAPRAVPAAPRGDRRPRPGLERGALTLRGYDRVLKLAWTVRDLDGGGTPTRSDVGLALTLRARSAVAA